MGDDVNASSKSRSDLGAKRKQADTPLTPRTGDDRQATARELPNTARTAVSPRASGTKAEVAAPPQALRTAKVGKAKGVAAESTNAQTAAESPSTKPTAQTTIASADAADPTAKFAPSDLAKGKGTRKVRGATAKGGPAGATKKAAAASAVSEVTDGKKDKGEEVVRDSFSMPAGEHRRIKALREQAGKAGRLASKSEVLRAGLILLGERSGEDLVALLERLPLVRKGKRSKKR